MISILLRNLFIVIFCTDAFRRFESAKYNFDIVGTHLQEGLGLSDAIASGKYCTELI